MGKHLVSLLLVIVLFLVIGVAVKTHNDGGRDISALLMLIMALIAAAIGMLSAG